MRFASTLPLSSWTCAAGTVCVLILVSLGACTGDSFAGGPGDGGASPTFDTGTSDTAKSSPDSSDGAIDPCGDGGPDPAVFDKKTADGGACNLRKTHRRGLATSCLPIEEGEFCDALEFCIPQSAVADMAVLAPGFDCNQTGFGCNGALCVNRGPRVIDANTFAQMCAVTASSVTLLREVECWIYD